MQCYSSLYKLFLYHNSYQLLISYYIVFNSWTERLNMRVVSTKYFVS